MTQLLEMREKIKRFVGKYEKFVLALIKFLVALAAYSLINGNIGYMTVLNRFLIVLILALLCSFLPVEMMVVIGGALVLLHLYALSLPLCIVAAMLFLLMFCVYFRFAPKSGIQFLLMPVLSVFRLPYVLPVCVGLLNRPYTAISVAWGTVTFFFLKNVHTNAPLFSQSGRADSSMKETLLLALQQIYADKGIFVCLFAFVAAALIVYAIHRLAIEHAWTVASVVGMVVQLAIIAGGQIFLGKISEIFIVLIGCLVSMAIVLVVQFLTMHLDYTRVEYVQFEDDEYYYYVKAIPKTYVAQEDKQVKKISSKRGDAPGRREKEEA